jgi:anti-sigma regulatory factor (Ser/Thr protein kinase)
MSSVRPLMGLYAGADDKAGLMLLVIQGAVLNLGGVGLVTLVTEIWPQWFYAINGVADIPEGGLLCVKLYALSFMFKGFNSLFRMYLSNRNDSRYATRLIVVGNATLPLFAFILWKTAPTPYIFLTYLFIELLIFAMSYFRYLKWLEKDRKDIEENGEDIQLYMTVRPDEAVEASRELRSFAEEHGINKRIAYRTALCMEEMAGNIVTHGFTKDKKRHSADIRVVHKDDSILLRIRDDCTAFNPTEYHKVMKMDEDGKNAGIQLVYGIAREVQYQNLLGMNVLTILI